LSDSPAATAVRSAASSVGGAYSPTRANSARATATGRASPAGAGFSPARCDRFRSRRRCRLRSPAADLPPIEAEGAADQRPVPQDYAVAAHHEIGPPEVLLRTLVALLHPDTQPIWAHHLSKWRLRARDSSPATTPTAAGASSGRWSPRWRAPRWSADNGELQLGRPPSRTVPIGEAPHDFRPRLAQQPYRRLVEAVRILHRRPVANVPPCRTRTAPSPRRAPPRTRRSRLRSCRRPPRGKRSRPCGHGATGILLKCGSTFTATKRSSCRSRARNTRATPRTRAGAPKRSDPRPNEAGRGSCHRRRIWSCVRSSTRRRIRARTGASLARPG
jgi:hypothetical protein